MYHIKLKVKYCNVLMATIEHFVAIILHLANCMHLFSLGNTATNTAVSLLFPIVWFIKFGDS